MVGWVPMVQELKKDERTYYRCEVCGFAYREHKIAERCEAWCREHKSCNLEIIKQAITLDSPE